MKRQAMNPFLPIDEYIPDGERMYLGNGSICLDPMTQKEVPVTVQKRIMCVG